MNAHFAIFAHSLKGVYNRPKMRYKLFYIVVIKRFTGLQFQIAAGVSDVPRIFIGSFGNQSVEDICNSHQPGMWMDIAAA